MALPSQSSRVSIGITRSNMTRRKRPNLGPVLAAAGIVLVVVVGFWALMRTDKNAAAVEGARPEGAGTAAPTAALDSGQAPKVLATNQPANQPLDKTAVEPQPKAEPPVMEIRQGRSGAASTDQSQAQRTATPSNSGGLGNVRGGGADNANKPATPAASPAGSPADSPAGAPLPALPPSPAPGPTPAPSGVSVTIPPEVAPTVAAAKQKVTAGDVVAARVLYSRALADGRLLESDRQALREELTKINDDLVFSLRVDKNDPFVESYTVQGGDSLTKIAKTLGIGADWRLIQRVNRMANPNQVRLGQRLKVVKGPFHAVVHKSVYRMDVYMGPPERPEQWVYVRSFRVGLGEANSTPAGTFISKKGSKLIDPPWINPRTGERFAGGDPKNPIGHRWVGIEGVGESAQHTGYGLHGTIEPESIGQQRSMGCVRLAREDIELVYELMGEGVSVVRIVP